MDQSIPIAKTPIVNNTDGAINTSGETKPPVIDSVTDENDIPEAPGKGVNRPASPSTTPRQRRLSDDLTPSASMALVGGDTVVRSSQINSTFAITPSSGIRMVPRRAPPSPAGSIKATKFSTQGEVDIFELSEGEDAIEVPTMMPPSPPVSATYSYTSFSEIVPTTNKLRRSTSTESNLSDSSEEEEINPRDGVPGSTMVDVEQTPRARLSSVMRGKRPSRMQTADSFAYEPGVQWIDRLIEFGSRQPPPTSSKEKNKMGASPKGKAVDMKPFNFGTSPNPGPSTQPRKTSGPAYGVEAGLRQMADDERLFAQELRRMEEEDRKLAEKLQRIEDEGRLGNSKEEEEEWKQILLIEDEEIARFKEEADRLILEDEILARALMEQDEADRLIYEDEMLARALMEQEEADMEERRREHEERERERAARQKRLDSIQSIGATAGIRRVERFGRLSNVDLDELTEDTINRLKQVKTIFTMGLPGLPVTQVEWIMNEKLRTEFDDCREQLRRAGRSTEEVLLWHGTQAKNITPYTLTLHHLTLG